MEVYTSAPPFLPPGTEAGNIGPLRCCLLHEVGGGTKNRLREVVSPLWRKASISGGWSRTDSCCWKDGRGMG
nr:MAG TPA: hypothetical protein [Caudoviricetes sp.]